LLLQREHHEVLLQRELVDLVDGVDLAGIVAQRGFAPEAVDAGQQHVRGGDVAAVADGERGADRVVLVVALLEGELLVRKRFLVLERVVDRLGRHHLEGRRLDRRQALGIERGGGRRRQQAQARGQQY